MRERRPSREERHQREKEELSRQKLQEQAFMETQRNVFARIRRGEDDWDASSMGSWDIPPSDWDPPPLSRSRYGEDWTPYGEDYYDDPPAWNESKNRQYNTPVSRRYLEDDRYGNPVSRRNAGGYDTPPSRRYPEDTPGERPHEDDTVVRRGSGGYGRDSGYGSGDSWEDTQVRKPSPEIPPIEDDDPSALLNPAIRKIQWSPPEEPREKKRSRRKPVLIVLLVLAVLLVALAAVHQILVQAPELPETEEGISPSLLEAGRREGVYTFLLVGRDDGGGGNTDTIMVGTFDTENGTADVLSIFRDTLVDVPWEIKKINSVYNRQGIEGLKEQVKNLVGFIPDYYFVVEMGAVAEIVDAIGGVDYAVPYNMDYDDPTQDLHIHFAQGMQHLNGEDAVKVLRWRKNNSGEDLSVGDIGRVEIQHDFLKCMAKQTLSLGNVTKLRQLARIVDESLTSDLSYGEMFWFGERALGLQEDGLRFHSLPGDYTGTMWSPTYQNYQSYVFVNDGELLALVNESMNPYLEDIPAENQHVLNGTTVSSQTTLP